MKPRTKKVLWIGLAVFALIYIIYYFLPYPPQMYYEAKKATAYFPDCPISEMEYAKIKKQVEEKLEGLEIISGIDVKSDSEIEIWTLQNYRGPLAAYGRIFKAIKYDGQ